MFSATITVTMAKQTPRVVSTERGGYYGYEVLFGGYHPHTGPRTLEGLLIVDKYTSDRWQADTRDKMTRSVLVTNIDAVERDAGSPGTAGQAYFYLWARLAL